MSSPQEPATGDTAPDHSRSGDDVAEAIGVAERGSAVREVHDRGAGNTTAQAPVEQTAGDPAMTEGQVVGEGEGGRSASSGPAPSQETSGAAQSVVGARTPDRIAAGEEPPADPAAR
ncbi:hypothetical protein [Blastococcus deserti]|uniref:Uncharacterized protein n=1 Tax=Blastococcus deserti TaxID=2259033 RepID=A0ABW4XEN1_9ACTN